MLGVVCSAAGFAGIVAPASLEQMAGSAETIVVAEAAGAVGIGTWLSVSLRVDRVLKGGADKGQLIEARWESTGRIGAAKRLEGRRGLWFLSASASGQQSVMATIHGSSEDVADLFFPAVAGPLPTAFSYDPSDALLDRLLLEVCAGAADVTGDKASIDEHRFLGALYGLDSAAARRCYDTLAVSPARHIRSMGLAGLIRLGDVVALRRAIEGLRLRPPEFLLPWTLNDFRNPDPEAVVLLGAFAVEAEGQGEQVQHAAVYPLRVMHTKESLPYLVRLLDSPHQSIRYQAMAGLASFANIGHIPLSEKIRSLGQPIASTRGPYTTDETLQHFPTSENFKKDEARYISFWKIWWTQVQDELTR
jgi:hypothetical protein